ncbi:MAG: KH domain-containing protein [Caldilineaceae bacterium]|nr:KH domain-containing protein [Caldilineaceae bacterium]
MEKLVEFLAKSLVENPDGVEVSQRAYRDRVVVRLVVDQEDTGRVIGKGGRVANAIRTVMRVAAANDGRDVTLKIL